MQAALVRRCGWKSMHKRTKRVAVIALIVYLISLATQPAFSHLLDDDEGGWGRSVRAMSSSNGNGVISTTQDSVTATSQGPLNVLGTPLECCCRQPLTGYYRDGFCKTDASDRGRHVVCARVTQQFLEYSKSRGNDLMTPAPWYNFPGLKDGDKWCLCASRWSEALEAGVAPPVYLRCTHAKALEYVTMEQLKAHALDLDATDN